MKVFWFIDLCGATLARKYKLGDIWLIDHLK